MNVLSDIAALFFGRRAQPKDDFVERQIQWSEWSGASARAGKLGGGLNSSHDDAVISQGRPPRKGVE